MRKRSISRWRRTIACACSRPSSVKLERLVVGAADVAVVLEPADHLVHGRRRELHRAGDVGAGDRQPRLLEPEHALEVLLLGDGGVLVGIALASLRDRGRTARRRRERMPPCGSSPARRRSSPAPRAGSAARCARRSPPAGRPSGLLARGRERLEELAAQLPGDGGSCARRRRHRARRDRSGRSSASSKRAGGLDLLVANAGIAHYGPFADAELEQAEEMVARQRARHALHGRRRASAHARPRPRAHRGRLLGRGPPRLSLGAPSTAARRRSTAASPRRFATSSPAPASGDDRLPGRGRDRPPRPRARARCPTGAATTTSSTRRESPAAIVDGVEADRRDVYAAGAVRLLGPQRHRPAAHRRAPAPRPRARRRRRAATERPTRSARVETTAS